MRRRQIVAAIGVDGAGKSTQARLVAQRLNGQGISASHFEDAGGRSTMNRMARRLGRSDGPELFGRGYVALESSIRWLAIARALIFSRTTGGVAVMDRHAHCQYAVMPARADQGEHRARAELGLFPRRHWCACSPSPFWWRMQRWARPGLQPAEIEPASRLHIRW